MNIFTYNQASIILSTTLGLSLLLLAGIAPASAEQLALLESEDTWQNNRLLEPTPAQLKQEQRGTIMIYDGLTDVTVAKALRTQFDRIQNMMFTRVIRTGENGQPLKDDSGRVVVEDDGC